MQGAAIISATALYLLLAWAVGTGWPGLGGAMPPEPLKTFLAACFLGAAIVPALSRGLYLLGSHLRSRVVIAVWLAVVVIQCLVAGVCVILGASILWEHDAAVLGVLFLAAGIAMFVAIVEGEDWSEEQRDWRVYPRERPAETGTSQARPLETLIVWLNGGISTTPPLAAALAAFAFGSNVFWAAKGILVYGEVTTLEEARSIVFHFSERQFYSLLFIPFTPFIAFVLIGICLSIWEAILAMRFTAASRPLAQSVVDDIEERAQAIEAYARAENLGERFGSQLIALAVFIAGAFGGLVAGVLAGEFGASVLYSARPASADFRLVEYDSSFSFILGLGSMLLGFAAPYYLGAMWPRFGAVVAWDAFTGEDGEAGLRGRLARLARTNGLGMLPRKPRAALRALHGSVIQYVSVPGWIAFWGGIAFFAFELQTSRIATPQGVAFATKWGREEVLRPYTEVSAYRVACSFDSKQRPVVQGELVFPDATVWTFEKQGHVSSRLAALVALDGILRKTGVRFEWQAGDNAFDPDCVDALIEALELDAQQAKQVRTIFRLDEWRAQK